jgi:hypothetical protein
LRKLVKHDELVERGAQKSRSRSGYLSFFVFIACGLIFFILSPSLLGVSENAYLRASYEPFQRMAFYFGQQLNVSDVNTFAGIYASALVPLFCD